VANPPTLPIPAVDTTSCRGLLSQARAGRQPVCRPLLRTGGAVPPCPPAARLGRPFVHAGRRPRPWASPPIPVGFNRRPSVRRDGSSPRRNWESPAARATGPAPGNRVVAAPSWPYRPPRGTEAPAPHSKVLHHIGEAPAPRWDPRHVSRGGFATANPYVWVLGFCVPSTLNPQPATLDPQPARYSVT
jgi:hypothetical protein